MKDTFRKALLLLTFLLLLPLLSSCRSRVMPEGQPGNDMDSSLSMVSSDSEKEGTEALEPDPGNEPDGFSEEEGKSRENPESDRLEHDDLAEAEIRSGQSHILDVPGEGEGAPESSEDAGVKRDRLREEGDRSALQTMTDPQADTLGVSHDAEASDSAITYYTVLLSERMKSLFECQRSSVYLETVRDHETVFRASPEHLLILSSGAYDVSSRLMEENLIVDDSWIVRKNPGVIVKISEEGVLGRNVLLPLRADALRRSILAREGFEKTEAVRKDHVLLLSSDFMDEPHLRLVSSLAIAMEAAPDLFGDVKLEEALDEMCHEAWGTGYGGIFFYRGGSAP